MQTTEITINVVFLSFCAVAAFLAFNIPVSLIALGSTFIVIDTLYLIATLKLGKK